MADVDAHLVLRCEGCNKPFDKQSTLKRHGYYCRSRKAEKAIRSRSCLSCAAGKARCDKHLPQCSRCTQKGISCQYPARTVQTSGLREQPSHNDAAADFQTASTAMNQGMSNITDVRLDFLSSVPDSLVMNPVDGILDWDSHIDFADLLYPPAQKEQIRPLSASPTIFQTPTASSSPSVAPNQIPFYDPTFQPSIPKALTPYTRTLSKRVKLRPGAHGIADLIFNTFKSYPGMLSRSKIHLPFVHQQLLDSATDDTDMEPLNNCISLMHMISSGVSGSRKLFWRNVRQECERFCQEYQEKSRWEVLAALQALSIYFIIRLDEGETEHNDFDYLLYTALIALCTQLAHGSAESDLESHDLTTNWKDWVFEESRRRVCLVYRVMNLVVDFGPAKLCNLRSDDMLMLLPGKKQLWEARNEVQWKTADQAESKTQELFALGRDSELVKLKAARCSIELLTPKSIATSTPESAKNWQEWCSGMDELGGLVMLAASLKV